MLKEATENVVPNAGRSNLVTHYSSPATHLKMDGILNVKNVKTEKGKARNNYD